MSNVRMIERHAAGSPGLAASVVAMLDGERWAYLDSQARSLSAWLMAPVLFLTLMLGPMGLLAYLVLRGRR